MVTITLDYTATARSVSQGTLATALSAQPRDASVEAVLGLVPVSDTTIPVGAHDTRRRIKVHTSAASPVSDASMYGVLKNFYTKAFALGLACPIVAAPPV